MEMDSKELARQELVELKKKYGELGIELRKTAVLIKEKEKYVGAGSQKKNKSKKKVEVENGQGNGMG